MLRELLHFLNPTTATCKHLYTPGRSQRPHTRTHGCKHTRTQSGAFFRRALMILMNQFSVRGLFWCRLLLFWVLPVVLVCCWSHGLWEPIESSADSGTRLVWDYSTGRFLHTVTFAAAPLRIMSNGNKSRKCERLMYVEVHLLHQLLYIYFSWSTHLWVKTLWWYSLSRQ